MLKSASRQADSSSHLKLSHLILLVSEAVLELACLSLPGYTLARKGMFDAEMQKSVANLTLILFTPCLSTPSTMSWSHSNELTLTVFVNIASQTIFDKSEELAIIVLIFGFQAVVSYLCAIGTSKLFGFSKRPRNFVVAMAVSPLKGRRSGLNAYNIVAGLRKFGFNPLAPDHFSISDCGQPPMGPGAR